MFSPIRSVFPMLMVFSMCASFLPQVGLAQNTVEIVEPKLSPDTITLIRRNPDDALQVLMAYAFSCSDDGVVTEENDAVVRSIRKAFFRAGYIQLMLNMDLDADGNVSRHEFKSYTRSQEPLNRTRSEMIGNEADTDGNGVVIIAEMLKSAQMKLDKSSMRSGGIPSISNEILQMDVDGDGHVTIGDITPVVQCISD